MNERMNELWHGMNQIEMNERDRILNTQLNNKFHTENRVKIVMKSYNRMFNHNLSLLFRSSGVFHSHIIIFIIFFSLSLLLLQVMSSDKPIIRGWHIVVIVEW